jgi:hypothetical protein
MDAQPALLAGGGGGGWAIAGMLHMLCAAHCTPWGFATVSCFENESNAPYLLVLSTQAGEAQVASYTTPATQSYMDSTTPSKLGQGVLVAMTSTAATGAEAATPALVTRALVSTW